MAVDFYSFEMLTGRRLTPLPVTSGSWSIGIGVDDKIACTIKADAAATAKLQVWQTCTIANTGLLVVVDGVPVAAGPLWKRSYVQGKTIELTAAGLRSYWDRRLLLPVEARTEPFVDAGTGEPNAALDFAATGLSMGTIAKRYVELAQAWPDGALPLVLPADEAGVHGDTVKAVDLKTVRRVLDNLQDREGGPDIAFTPRWAADGLGIYWEMQVGTNAQPRLGNPDPSLLGWVIGAPKGGAFDLKVDEEGTALASEAFASGGRSAAKVIIRRGFDDTLIERDLTPLLQVAVTGLSTVETEARVQEYADARAYLGQFTASSWSMKVRAHEKGSPTLGDFWVGDYATLTVDAREPVLPTGTYPRRIVSIAGDERGDAYDLVFAEAVA